MSSGQKPRTSEFFPKMKVRGLRRRYRHRWVGFAINPDTTRRVVEALEGMTQALQEIPKALKGFEVKRDFLLGGLLSDFDYIKEDPFDAPQTIRPE